MQKKFITFLTALAVTAVVGGIAACDNDIDGETSSSSSVSTSTFSTSSSSLSASDTAGSSSAGGGSSVSGNESSDDNGNGGTSTGGESSVVHNHSYGERVVEATCTAEGYTLYTCECGDSYQRKYTEKLEHEPSEWIVDKEPTCSTEGKKHIECTVCKTEIESEAIEVLFHTMEKWSFDYDMHWKECSKCSAVDYGGIHSYENDECVTCKKKKPLYTRTDKDGTENAQGEYIYFGSYPQTKVTDTALVGALTGLAGTLPVHGENQAWTSYRYYMSNSNDFTWYQDVSYNGEKYRGVYFTSYRLMSANYEAAAGYQQKNGYAVGEVYWFAYEPIQWRILEESTENGEQYATVLCEMLIDCQEYQKYYTYKEHYAADENRNALTDKDGNPIYANHYAESSIRKWLNDAFYQTAFTQLQQAVVQTVTVDNGVETTIGASNYDGRNPYVCEDTQDKVWLLSHTDITNEEYGFKKTYVSSVYNSSGVDEARQKCATDYARCQGVWTGACGNVGEAYQNKGYWWLRSPSATKKERVEVVDLDGSSNDDQYDCYHSFVGVCPAIKILL